jgi:hypothetical protein
MLEIRPKSIQNLGGFSFNYTAKNVEQDMNLHRIFFEVKNKALRQELGDVFEKFPSPVGKNYLTIDVNELNHKIGGFSINSQALLTLRMEDFLCGEENLPIFSKLAKLTKLISQGGEIFQKEDIFINGNINKYNKRCGGLLWLADFENPAEKNIAQRYNAELSIKRLYDPQNIKDTASAINRIINCQMRHFLNLE